jgi:HlyD family secretion protein
MKIKAKLKSKWLWVIVVIILVIVVVGFFNANSKNKVTYTTVEAVMQNIKQTVDVTGTIESADNIDLNFASSGTLKELLVKVGDQVKINQKLASLAAGDTASQVANAQASLDIAKSDLEQLLAGASGEDIKVTEEGVVKAKIAYQKTQDDLADLAKTRDQAMTDLKATTLDTMHNKYFIAQYALDIVYDVIMDNEADTYLYVSNVSYLTAAKNYYDSSKVKYNNFAGLLAKAEQTESQEDILKAADYFKDTLDEISKTLTKTFDVMLVTVVNSEYTTTAISNFKTSLNTQSAAINAAISAVQTDISNLRTQDLYYQTQITAYNNNVASALNNLNLAQAQLDLKKAPPRSFEIEAARARVRQAQANLSKYLNDFAETTIKAPVDGIITKINFDLGEKTSLAEPVISMIGLSQLQIEVDVPESDISKIMVGDNVEITLGALSNDRVFKGTVTFIDPASTVIDGVVYYKVKVTFNEKDETIKSGMTADLVIATATKENVLAIPSRAIIYREGKKYVQVLGNDDKRVTEKEVSIGLIGDDGMAEVLSGVQVSEKVITFTKQGK